MARSERKQSKLPPPPPPPPQPEKEEEKIELQTAPFDPRFPNANQTRYCFQMYVDFHRCQKIRGVEYQPCEYFQKVYQSICPNDWIRKWDQQIEDGTFPGDI